MLARMWRKGNPLTLLVEMQLVQPTLENCIEFPQEVKNRDTLQVINFTTEYLPQRYRCSEMKEYLHPNVCSSNVHNSQTVERAKTSIIRQMDKENITEPSERMNTYHLHGRGWNWRVLC